MKKNWISWTNTMCFLSIIFVVSTISGCGGPLFKRTTTVYGKVFDNNHQPLDSIPIFMLSLGIGKHAGTPIAEAYTDKEGNYRIVLDVPRGYSSVVVEVNFNAERTEKFKQSITYVNGVKALGYGSIGVGDKVNYDFELQSK